MDPVSPFAPLNILRRYLTYCRIHCSFLLASPEILSPFVSVFSVAFTKLGSASVYACNSNLRTLGLEAFSFVISIFRIPMYGMN